MVFTRRRSMRKELWAVLAVLGIMGGVHAGPTIDEVAASPESFKGQTFTWKVDLMGNVATGQLKYRFTVRTPAGKVFKETPSAGQNLVFRSSNKNESIRTFVESLKPDYYYPVTLTVRIQGNQAIVEKVESAPKPLYEKGR
jgi:hypothetical protein